MEAARDKEDEDMESEEEEERKHKKQKLEQEELQPQNIKQQMTEVLKRLDNVEKRLTNLEKEASREIVIEKEIEPEKEILDFCSDFETTVCDRIIYNMSEIPQNDKPDESRENNESDRQKVKEGLINNRAILWHVRMGHASISYLKKYRKTIVPTPELEETVYDDTILDCDVCVISRINRLPLKPTGQRAKEPLEIIHFDFLGKISPASYPKNYKYISIFTDDYSQLAMAYPMKTKDEAGYYLELFIKKTQNLIGREAKVSCLKCYQESQYTSVHLADAAEKLDIELELVEPESPKHNQIFNHTLQKKVRVLMYDSGLPENMWDLALGVAVFAYNRTPHSANDMKIPLKEFNPSYTGTDLTRLRRFGCLSYVKVQRKMPNQKNRFIIKRLILVGYNETGYILFNPEDGKFYKTVETRFNEKCVFAEKYMRANVNNWESVGKEIDTDTWFVQFEKEEAEQKKIVENEAKSISYNKRGREW